MAGDKNISVKVPRDLGDKIDDYFRETRKVKRHYLSDLFGLKGEKCEAAISEALGVSLDIDKRFLEIQPEETRHAIRNTSVGFLVFDELVSKLDEVAKSEGYGSRSNLLRHFLAVSVFRELDLDRDGNPRRRGYVSNPYYASELAGKIDGIRHDLLDIVSVLVVDNGDLLREEKDLLIALLKMMLICLGEGVPNPPKEFPEAIPQETKRVATKIKDAAGTSKTMSDAGWGIIRILEAIAKYF